MAHEIARGHIHIQTTPSTTWTVDHGAGNDNIQVDVFVDVAGTLTKMIPKLVEMPTTSTVVITFSTAQFGEAYII